MKRRRSIKHKKVYFAEGGHIYAHTYGAAIVVCRDVIAGKGYDLEVTGKKLKKEYTNQGAVWELTGGSDFIFYPDDATKEDWVDFFNYLMAQAPPIPKGVNA